MDKVYRSNTAKLSFLFATFC